MNGITRIKAKTESGMVVTIVGFINKYNKAYAVIVRHDGSLWSYPIENLTVI